MRADHCIPIPEILRTNLAAVILQMISLRLGDINEFPFIDAPTDRQISDGIRLLEELGAIKEASGNSTDKIELTATGSLLSRYHVIRAWHVCSLRLANTHL